MRKIFVFDLGNVIVRTWSIYDKFIKKQYKQNRNF